MRIHEFSLPGRSLRLPLLSLASVLSRYADFMRKGRCLFTGFGVIRRRVLRYSSPLYSFFIPLLAADDCSVGPHQPDATGGGVPPDRVHVVVKSARYSGPGTAVPVQNGSRLTHSPYVIRGKSHRSGRYRSPRRDNTVPQAWARRHSPTAQSSPRLEPTTGGCLHASSWANSIKDSSANRNAYCNESILPLCNSCTFELEFGLK